MGNSGASLHITYQKNIMTNIDDCKIYVTVGNGQKMKCELKGTVNMNLQKEEMIKLTAVIYVPQEVKNILSVSRLISKGFRMGDTKDKITTNRNNVNILLDSRKGINDNTSLYSKAKRYAPEGSKPQKANINLP